MSLNAFYPPTYTAAVAQELVYGLFLSKEQLSPNLPLFVGVCVCVCSVVPTLYDLMDYSPSDSSGPRNFPDKNTGMGSHSLLQGILLTQGWNRGLLRCAEILYH